MTYHPLTEHLKQGGVRNRSYDYVDDQIIRKWLKEKAEIMQK